MKDRLRRALSNANSVSQCGDKSVRGRTVPTDLSTAFVSYSRIDAEFALKLGEDLKAGGANVWLDQLDIEPGERWARAVQAALNAASRVLVILSPASLTPPMSKMRLLCAGEA
jgi:hypothetical protein